MTTNSSAADTIRIQAWNEAVHTYGTGYIFERRANIHRLLLRAVAFLGLVVPLTIGGIYLSFQSQKQLLNVALIVAGIVGVLQLIISAWSLAARWEETYSYALESLGANYSLSSRFEKLGRLPPSKISELQTKFDLLQTENALRTDQDNKQGITDKEKRMGMRAALRNFQRKCSGCQQIPTSMTPSNCDVCGNF